MPLLLVSNHTKLPNDTGGVLLTNTVAVGAGAKPKSNPWLFWPAPPVV